MAIATSDVVTSTIMSPYNIRIEEPGTRGGELFRRRQSLFQFVSRNVYSLGLCSTRVVLVLNN